MSDERLRLMLHIVGRGKHNNITYDSTRAPSLCKYTYDPRDHKFWTVPDTQNKHNAVPPLSPPHFLNTSLAVNIRFN